MAYEYQGSMAEIASRVESYKRNPTLIQRAILDYLTEITKGEITVVDATNPFVFLLEASAVNTSVAISQNAIGLRKQHPSLAQTDEEIFRHLTDAEIMGRFANPSNIDFIFMMPYLEVRQNMVYDPLIRAERVTIAKDSYVSVDGVEYTLNYPINITLHETGGLKVSYGTDEISPIEKITTNNIIPQIKTSPDGTQLLYFTTKIMQLSIFSQEYPIESKAVFRKRIAIKDKFYYARAYHKGSATGSQWQEINTTHTDQVYDLNRPTVCFKVLESELEVYIPHVYITNGLIGSSLRVDIYTTKGAMTVDYSDYDPTSFTLTHRAIDEAKDESIYTTSMRNINVQPLSIDVNSGGSDGISFEKLRERTIYHANGVPDIPITTAELSTKLESNGFDLVKSVDTVTNRILYATRSLPSPNNKRLASAVNVTIGTTILDSDNYIDSPYIRVNNKRTTLLPGNLYENVNGIITMLSYDQIYALKTLETAELINTVNNRKFLYTPYYYILDSSNPEFDIRTYELDSPTRGEVNFVSQNDTMQMPVNSGDIVFNKIASGYEILFKTVSGNYYKSTTDGDVGLQVGFYPNGQSHMAYINAEMVGRGANDNERIWRVVLETTYDVNEEDCLAITNAKMFVDEPLTVWMDLNTKLHILHHSLSVTTLYVADNADSMLGRFIINPDSRVITYETIDITVGASMSNLWRRCRNIPTGQTYKKYDVDVPLYYTENIYKTDENGIVFTVENGSIVYEILHHVGDPVLDSKGEQLYSHRAGDVVLDINGNPVTVDMLRTVREVDILFLDGSLYFVTDEAFLAYEKQVTEIVRDWVTDDIANIEKTLLDKTRVYFYPKSTLGKINVHIAGNMNVTIDSEQAFVLDLYVTKAVYDNNDVREAIRSKTVAILDEHIKLEEVNMNEINMALNEAYGDDVISFKINGLGGSRNLNIVKVLNPERRLCIDKRVTALADGRIILEDNVVLNFIRY